MALTQVFPNRVPANAYAEIQLYGGYGSSSFVVKFNGVASELTFFDAITGLVRAILPPGTVGETVDVEVQSNGGTFALADCILRTAAAPAASRIYARYTWEAGTTSAITGYGRSAKNPAAAAALVGAGKPWNATVSAYYDTYCLAQSKQDISDTQIQSFEGFWQPGIVGDAYGLAVQFRYPLTSEVRHAGSTLRAGVWKILAQARDVWASASNRTRLRFCLYVYRPSTGAIIGKVYDDTLNTSNPGPIGFVLDSTSRAVNFSFSGAEVLGLQEGDALHLEVWGLSTTTSVSQYMGPRVYFDGRAELDGYANGADISGVTSAFCLVAPYVLTTPAAMIASITPNTGSPLGGTAVTITGSGFPSGGAAFGRSAVGSSTTGSADSGYVNYDKFTAPAVTIRGLSIYLPASPANAAQRGRLAVYVDAGGVPGALVAATNEQVGFSVEAGWTEIAFATPVTLAAGTYWLAYTFNANISFPMSADGFRRRSFTKNGSSYDADPFPASAGTIWDYAPQGAPIYAVPVAGASVSFGGIAATSVVVVSSTTITCATPAHAAGVVDVVVDTTTLAAAFTYAWTFTVTPNHGPSAGGTRVRVARS